MGSFALLTALGAQIVLPTIPVPFTLQTFFVLLSGALLGPRK
ncbi:MAG: biotin transporter BioY, partial [Ignavibacteria bacterium]